MSEREAFEAYLRETKFPVLPVWKDGSPYQNYALEIMWKAWQASRRAALEEAAKAIEPRNPREDWTDYAMVRAEAAVTIRALSKDGQHE